jgi:hypothetical protein
MKIEIIILGVIILALVVAGGLIQVQTAYEHFPSERRTSVIGKRILWPWRDRWVTNWVPARSSMQCYRTVDSARMYGTSRLPTATHGLMLDRFHRVWAELKENGNGQPPPPTYSSKAADGLPVNGQE